MKYLKLALLQFLACTTFAQISIQDSTFQVISYWDLEETQSYLVSLNKVKIKETDTLSTDLIQYEVQITVTDSTEDSYIVEWKYLNFNSTSTNPLMQKITAATEDITVAIELSELGEIRGVKNWEEVRDYMAKSIDTLQSELKNIPNIDKILAQMNAMYSSKTQIEAVAIQDVQQFHNFHGAIYKLNERLEGTLKTPNTYFPDRPFDTEISIRLDEIDVENNACIIRSVQEVDADQLTATTFEFLNQMAKDMGQEGLKRVDLKKLQNTTYLASKIHASGWVIYSILTKEIQADGITNIEERVIELK